MPNPVRNPEADADAFVQAIRSNDAKIATERLQEDVRSGKTEPQYQFRFAQSVTKQLEEQHLLPQAASLLFSNTDAMKKLDVNHDGSVNHSDLSMILARPNLKREFNTIEQQMIGVLNSNTKMSDGYGNFTAEGLQNYAASANERHEKGVIAERIAADPKSVVDQIDRDGDRHISKSELATYAREVEKEKETRCRFT